MVGLHLQCAQHGLGKLTLKARQDSLLEACHLIGSSASKLATSESHKATIFTLLVSGLQVKFCDEGDETRDTPVTGRAACPEWALAHQRALCSAKLSILRRVPRRGLLSNVWSPQEPPAHPVLRPPAPAHRLEAPGPRSCSLGLPRQ